MEINESGQLLTLAMGKDSFAIPIEHVLEVLEIDKITRVPRAKNYLLGVINVRGSIIPIIDLRTKLHLPPQEEIDKETVSIIILELELNHEKTTLGIVTDRVSEVVTLKPEQIDPTPRIGRKLNNQLISGIGKVKDKFMIILDIDYLFSEEATNLRTMELPAPAV